MVSNSIQSNLCKGLRACGIPRKQSLMILNIVEKWLNSNGPEWTNDRIKALRQWYETCLTGHPEPPEWFRHSKEGYPLGIWKWVFDLKPAKALGVLSLNTVLYEEKLSDRQKDKFLHGLAGNGSCEPKQIAKLVDLALHSGKFPSVNPFFKVMPDFVFPTVFDMTGSIPVNDGRSMVRPEGKLGEALKALRLSWESVPQVTFNFLVRMDKLGYIPMSVIGNAYQLELDRPHSPILGRVSVLQQPQLKARVIGNPNRVLQKTLEPLKSLYMETARKLPTDCTHDQESGVRWVQDQLKRGIELSGSDLTSASDLLQVSCCLDLVDCVYGFYSVRGYQEHRWYFEEVSRGKWACPALNDSIEWQQGTATTSFATVGWDQGDVLGTGPSFGLLTLTNNAAASLALYQCQLEGIIDPSLKPKDCFRVIGDDIVMRSEIEPHYTKIIEYLGGEINHSKTLKSDKVAEFAGRVITPDSCYLKAIKYSEPSDNSFMNYVAQLGDQAKHLLRPRQRHVYDRLAEVPGIVVPGPFMPDSYGVSLSDRYQWYLEEVEPALARVEPDLDLEDYQLVLLKAQLSLEEDGLHDDPLINYDEPLIDEGYLPSMVTPTFKVGGDPRLTDGKTALEVLESKVKDITPFKEWKRKRDEDILNKESHLENHVSLDDKAKVKEALPKPKSKDDDFEH